MFAIRHRSAVCGRHANSDDLIRTQGDELTCPTRLSAGVANNYAVQRYTDSPSDKAAVARSTFRCRSVFAPSADTAGATRISTAKQHCRCRPEAGGNFTVRNDPAGLRSAPPFVQSNRSVLDVRFGWSSVHGLSRGFSVALPPVRSKPTAISGLPTDPRISGGLPTQIINQLYKPRTWRRESRGGEFPSTWNRR